MDRSYGSEDGRGALDARPSPTESSPETKQTPPTPEELGYAGHQGLMYYLESLGCSSGTLDIVAQQVLDGREWIDALVMAGDAAAEYLTDEYDVNSAAMGIRLKLHARRGKHALCDAAEEMQTKQQCATDETLNDYHRDCTKGAPRQRFEEKTVLPNAAAWRQYMVGWQSHAELYSSAMGSIIGDLLIDATININELCDGLNAHDQRWDIRLGAYFYNDSTLCIQDELEDERNRLHDGRPSLVVMLKTLSLLIDHRSLMRSTRLVKQLRNIEPVEDPGELYRAMDALDRLFKECERIGVGGTIGAVTKIGIVDDLLEPLVGRPDLRVALHLPAETFRMEHPGDGNGLWKTVKLAALDLQTFDSADDHSDNHDGAADEQERNGLDLQSGFDPGVRRIRVRRRD